MFCYVYFMMRFCFQFFCKLSGVFMCSLSLSLYQTHCVLLRYSCLKLLTEKTAVLKVLPISKIKDSVLKKKRVRINLTGAAGQDTLNAFFAPETTCLQAFSLFFSLSLIVLASSVQHAVCAAVSSLR